MGSFLKKALPFASMALSASPLAPLLPAINAAFKLVGKPELPETAQVQQAIDAYQSTPEVQAELDSLALSMEQENTKQLAEIVKADVAGAGTRPHGYLVCVYTMAFTTVVTVLAIFVTLWEHGLKDANNVLQLGLGIMALLAPFAAVMMRYNGIRTNEKMMRYAVGMGHSPNTIQQPGLVESFIGTLRKQ